MTQKYYLCQPVFETQQSHMDVEVTDIPRIEAA